ncbi:MAG: DUF4390 domain-containing protein [Deltaproteobacteria bacterium]|nr:DUF4390 domain-containing protein [Deltaproteobacteria bacterium]MBW2069938.1 DUF4390 domain-containing protein [Deltaproteobacteria bacterium]
MKRTTLFSFLFFFTVSASVVSASSRQPEHILVFASNGAVLVRVGLGDDLCARIQHSTMDGIPVNVAISVVFSRIRSLWLDEKLTEVTIQRTLKYDLTRKNYVVLDDNSSQALLTTPSFTEAMHVLFSVEHLKLAPTTKLHKGEHYQIRARAEVTKKGIPPILRPLLTIFPRYSCKTDWYVLDFSN